VVLADDPGREGVMERNTVVVADALEGWG